MGGCGGTGWEEGWATVICRSINCRPGRGPCSGLLLLWPPQEYLHSPTLALTREGEIVEPWLFAGGGEPGQRHHISDRGALSKRGKFSKVCKKGRPLHAITPPLQFCWKCPNNGRPPRGVAQPIKQARKLQDAQAEKLTSFANKLTS